MSAALNALVKMYGERPSRVNQHDLNVEAQIANQNYHNKKELAEKCAAYDANRDAFLRGWEECYEAFVTNDDVE